MQNWVDFGSGALIIRSRSPTESQFPMKSEIYVSIYQGILSTEISTAATPKKTLPVNAFREETDRRRKNQPISLDACVWQAKQEIKQVCSQGSQMSLALAIEIQNDPAFIILHLKKPRGIVPSFVDVYQAVVRKVQKRLLKFDRCSCFRFVEIDDYRQPEDLCIDLSKTLLRTNQNLSNFTLRIVNLNVVS